jgi:hypothetical protein
MPYVIKNDAGQWLRKYPHRTRQKREWVDELDKATIWEKIGHAKAAASHSKTTSTEIQEVRLILWGASIPHKPKRLR